MKHDISLESNVAQPAGAGGSGGGVGGRPSGLFRTSSLVSSGRDFKDSGMIRNSLLWIASTLNEYKEPTQEKKIIMFPSFYPIMTFIIVKRTYRHISILHKDTFELFCL